LIPTLYDKAWVQNTIEDKLLEDFKINLSVSSDITYNILPSPHFLIKDTKIFHDKSRDEEPKVISEVKYLKVFISQKNLVNKKRLNIKNILINDANFLLHLEDFKLFNKIEESQFSNKEIKVKNSNIFLKDSENESIALIKLDKAILLYDDLKRLNIINLKAEAFNVPIIFNSNNKISSTRENEVNLSIKKFKINFFNRSIKTNNISKGLNIFSISNMKLHTEYDVQDDVVTFAANDLKTINSNINYKGRLSLKPFDFKINIDLKKYSLSKFINNNSLVNEIFRSKILFNKNISAAISINTDSDKRNEIFNSSLINFNIINGKINLNKTRLINKRIGFLEINNSNFFSEGDKLIFNTDIIIKIENSDNLFSFFQTPKKIRKPVRNFFINLDYNLALDQMTINSIKVDESKNINEMINIIHEFSNDNDYNINTVRRIFNKLFYIYEG